MNAEQTRRPFARRPGRTHWPAAGRARGPRARPPSRRPSPHGGRARGGAQCTPARPANGLPPGLEAPGPRAFKWIPSPGRSSVTSQLPSGPDRVDRARSSPAPPLNADVPFNGAPTSLRVFSFGLKLRPTGKRFRVTFTFRHFNSSESASFFTRWKEKVAQDENSGRLRKTVGEERPDPRRNHSDYSTESGGSVPSD